MRAVALTAVSLGVLVLAAAAFVLSYSGIHAVAQQAGISATLARGYPVIFDALLVIACAAVLSLRGAGADAAGSSPGRPARPAARPDPGRPASAAPGAVGGPRAAGPGAAIRPGAATGRAAGEPGAGRSRAAAVGSAAGSQRAGGLRDRRPG
ncbi:MAG TPA: DUF2637 domain-containing protein [Streptosporangiaceae bacterium]|nr:DUF2637 domain-containing protein [Streptosporangiaceae bacterium]